MVLEVLDREDEGLLHPRHLFLNRRQRQHISNIRVCTLAMVFTQETGNEKGRGSGNGKERGSGKESIQAICPRLRALILVLTVLVVPRLHLVLVEVLVQVHMLRPGMDELMDIVMLSTSLSRGKGREIGNVKRREKHKEGKKWSHPRLKRSLHHIMFSNNRLALGHRFRLLLVDLAE